MSLLKQHDYASMSLLANLLCVQALALHEAVKSPQITCIKVHSSVYQRLHLLNMYMSYPCRSFEM